jgi:hypothetical protein
MYRNNQSRRGVILVVVLGMLALFALMSVTFVIVARQSRMSSHIDAKLDQVGDPPDRMNDQVLMQLLRGTNDSNSSLRHVSLLEDMYGNDEVLGRVEKIDLSTATSVYAGTDDGAAFGNGKVIEFTVSFESDYEDDRVTPSRNYVAQYYGYYNGLVLTMSGGAADGQSTRIVDYDVIPPTKPKDPPQRRLQVLAFENGVLPVAGDRFLINGRPFNGTGYGYARGSFDTSTESQGASFLLDAFDPSIADLQPTSWDDPTRAPYALLPNPVFFAPSNDNPFTNYTDPYDDPAGPGGADEDYDAADFQNLLLGAYVGDGSSMQVRIPSLHRPALVDYWIAKANLGPPTNVKKGWNDVGNDLAQALRRKILMRPSSLDHFNDLDGDDRRDEDGKVFTEPDFAGRMGALEFDPTSTDPANWDVDNDGDGVPDSVWVDAGLPVQSAPDGRLFKPMFAVLCVDMDGKINLNAHGTMHHAVAASGDYYVDQQNRAVPFTDYPVASTILGLPVGQGYGPAEINPAAAGSLFSVPDPSLYDKMVSMELADALRRLLIGYSEVNDASLAAADRVGEFAISGRYGEIPGNDTSQPGMSSNPVGGLPDFVHGLSQWETTVDYWNTVGAYGSPPDLSGDGAIAYDLVGQPLYVSNNRVPNPNDNTDIQLSGLGEQGDNLNDPYEIDLSACAAHIGYVRDGGTETRPIDSPFTVFELERVLRFHDADARELPDRILRLTEPFLGDRSTSSLGNYTPLDDDLARQSRRRMVTTCSFDLPTYNLSPLSHTAIVDVNKVLPAAGPNDAVPSFPPRTIVDLLAARLQVENGSNNGAHLLRNAMLAPVTQTIPTQRGVIRSFDALMSPELLAGLRMDLNRPFGNGGDDMIGGIFNGIVDEPFEDGIAQPLWPLPWTSTADTTNDGGLATDFPGESGIRIRQYYARHLYVLARLVLDQEFKHLANELLSNDPNITNLVEGEAEAARRFAQWAINVVDYRDADSIMTPFPYDINPFKDDSTPPDMFPNVFTWDVTDTYQAPMPGKTGIVWGMERPELLITETLAMHDRRTVDGIAGIGGNGNGDKRVADPDPMNQDDDFDQEKRPVGSLFVELFNPTGLNEHLPAELYDSGTNALRLDKRSPSSGDPVWRLAIVDPDRIDNDPDVDLDVFHRNPNLVPADIDRTVYFTDTAGPGINQFHRQAGASPILVLPQRYAVIGPSDRTVVEADAAAAGTGFEIKLDALAADPVDITTAGYKKSSSQVQKPVPVVVNMPRRLSVSEPIQGTALSTYDTFGPGSDDEAMLNNPLGTADDQPWDDYNDDLRTNGTLVGDELPVPLPNEPKEPEGYRVVALQRLADPTRPYDQFQNPYLTVDSMPVDLTVYNSESDEAVVTDAQHVINAEPFYFATRQRGAAQRAILSTRPNVDIPNPWLMRTQLPESEVNPGENTATYRWNIGSAIPGPQHTLGYLNRAYYELFGIPPTTGTFNPGHEPLTDQQLSRYSDVLLVNQQQYVGAPPMPFSTFVWPNRPFVSNTELMNVPWAGPAEMFSAFSLWPDSATSPNDPKPYNRGAAGNPGPAPDYMNAPNRHLINYYQSDGPGLTPTDRGLNFHRVLEFVQVPSRFAGTKEMLPPQGFALGNHTLHPPFNFVSRFRDPGRVNLNTILDNGETLQAMMNGTESLNTAWGNNNAPPLWLRLVSSRRGRLGGPPDPVGVLPGIPTFFPNPFRSYSGGSLVPIEEMRKDELGQPRHMVDSTLLRPDPAVSEQPLFTFDPGQAYLNGDTNANVRNLVYQKLGNMVTTRSNVYAIWITMGYFEVEAVDTTDLKVAAAYPGGYRLKQELGIDTGEIERHRSFYIIDRTIPVGFNRGEDLNVEKTILLKRFIE